MDTIDLLVAALEILAVAGAAYVGLYRRRPRLSVDWDIRGGSYAGVQFHNHGDRPAHRIELTFLDPPGSVYFLETPHRPPIFTLAPGESKTIDLTITHQLGRWLAQLDQAGDLPKPCRIDARYKGRWFHRPVRFRELNWDDNYKTMEVKPFEDRLLESLQPLGNLKSIKYLDNILKALQWFVCKHLLEPFNDGDTLICRKCHRFVESNDPYVEVGLRQDSQTKLEGVVLFRLRDHRPPLPSPSGLVPSGLKDQIAELTVYENDTTRPLFWGKNGCRFYGTFGPEGNAAGSPKWQFEGIGEVTHKELDAGAQLFKVRVLVDGKGVVKGKFEEVLK